MKLSILLTLAAIPFGVQAATLTIAKYSMLNGQSGFRTYHDDTYNGSGSPAVDGSSLSGGTGDLTNGVLGTDNIFDNDFLDWVGWYNIQPQITFDLGQIYAVDGILFRTANGSVVFNDVGVFGSANVSFSDDGTTFGGPSNWTTSAADRTGDQSRWVTIPVTAQARYVRVQLFDGVKVGEDLKPWIFISEAQITGSTVPEPATWMLLAAVVGLATKKGRRFPDGPSQSNCSER